MKRTHSSVSRQLLRSAVWICVATFSAGALMAAHEPGYGFYRTVEGEVRLTTLDRAEPVDVEPNYPLLLGDRVWVSPAGRLEVLLPDQTILRAAGNTDLYFEDLALYAEETAGQGTILRLLEGEIQLVVGDYRDQREPIRVDTPNATIYLQEAGVYRIYADDRQWTEVVVREGFGEVALAEGSVVVRANEEAVVDGEIDPRVRVYPAGALDALEAWGDELDREAQLVARDTYVDESLRYQSAPLRQHGIWVSVDSGWAWRPYVTVGWRPYTRGYWTYTPAGQYWVSAEPWGVTFHYGSWTHHPYHGWIWYPGTAFAPAWVTWYWGPSYVGWVPSGYYSSFYGPRWGLSFGFYGWAGGSWSYYSNWTFCPTRYFGWRSYGTYWRSGHEIARTAHHEVPRGAILGSTRGIPRGYVGRPEEVVGLVERVRGLERGPNRKIPDVTDFVARRETLSAEVREVVFTEQETREALLRQGRDSRGQVVSRIESPRTVVGDRGATTDRASAGGRISESVRSLPSRPDLSREELVARDPMVRRDSPSGDRTGRQSISSGVRTTEPIRSATPDRQVAGGGSERFDRSGPARSEPVRESPRSIETMPGRSTGLPPTARPTPGVGSGLSSTRFETREPLPRTDSGRSLEREMPARPGFSQPLSPSPRSLPGSPAPSAAGPGPGSDGRLPVVRRVLDGIRGIYSSPSAPSPPGAVPQPSSPSAPPSTRLSPAPPSSSAPSVSRPSPGVGSPPPSSIQRPSAPSPPQVSSPSSGSSMRSSASSTLSRGSSSSSSSSSSKSAQSSASARSQSRSRSKPPGD